MTRKIPPEGVSISDTIQSLREIITRLPTGALKSFPEISTRYMPGSVVCGFHCNSRCVSLSSPLASTLPDAMGESPSVGINNSVEDKYIPLSLDRVDVSRPYLKEFLPNSRTRIHPSKSLSPGILATFHSSCPVLTCTNELFAVEAEAR